MRVGRVDGFAGALNMGSNVWLLSGKVELSLVLVALAGPFGLLRWPLC